MKSESFGDIPMLAVVVDRPIDIRAALMFAKSKLGIRSPRKIIQVDSIPRNSGGKIDRLLLRSNVNGE